MRIYSFVSAYCVCVHTHWLYFVHITHTHNCHTHSTATRSIDRLNRISKHLCECTCVCVCIREWSPRLTPFLLFVWMCELGIQFCFSFMGTHNLSGQTLTCCTSKGYQCDFKESVYALYFGSPVTSGIAVEVEVEDVSSFPFPPINQSGMYTSQLVSAIWQFKRHKPAPHTHVTRTHIYTHTQWASYMYDTPKEKSQTSQRLS